jgi:WD40 repeat protein
VECVAAENMLKIDSHGPIVASGSAEGSIRLWDIRSKTAIKVLVSSETPFLGYKKKNPEP